MSNPYDRLREAIAEVIKTSCEILGEDDPSDYDYGQAMSCTVGEQRLVRENILPHLDTLMKIREAL